MNQQEFFLANAVDGLLTDEQMAQMLDLPEGDTGHKPESEVPDPASTTTEAAAGVETSAKDGEQAGQTQDNQDGEGDDKTPKVILAKDGVHTIPYDKLVQARQGEQNWKTKAEATEAALQAAQAQLAELQAQAQARADAGAAPTKTDNAVAQATAAIEQGVDPAIFGDFSEEAMVKGIQKLVQMGVEQALAPIRGELSKTVEPLKKQAELTETQAHYKTIYDAHPDADSLVESKELADWIGKQPSFVRDGYARVLTEGSAQQVVELFTAFKDATGKATATPEASGAAAAAKAAIANAKQPAPISLSEIPAGSMAHHDEASAMLDMSSANLLTKFDGKSPEQIAEMLNRVL